MRESDAPRGRPRSFARAVMSLLLAAPLLAIGAGAATAHVTPAAGFVVAVSASPSSGNVPLAVTLTATVSTGTPGTVAWSFGDGATWTGSGTSALSVTHRYASVGTFTASVTVYEAGGQASSSTLVYVESGSLVASIAATATSGSAPLAVTFRAVVSGGTGTYPSFTWSFGDGGVGVGAIVAYTFTHSGQFVVHLTVVDSSNDTAAASVPVAVSGPAGPLSTLEGLGPATLATAGIVGAGLTFGAYYGVRRRRHGHRGLPEDPDSVEALPPGIFGPSAPSPATGAAAGPAEASADLPASTEAAVASAGSSVELAPSPEAPPSPAGPRLFRTRTPRSPGEEPRRWSRDLVAYLGSLPTLGPDDIATLAWTQKGMSERLGTGQNQISNVLRRLCASGLVVEQLEHVQGQPRRLKVYRLTLRGETMAREVRRHRPASNPNLLRREW